MSAPPSAGVRPPAVAGTFYPGGPEQLAAQVDALLDAVVVPAGEGLAPAYVVPHAGYRYSGATAAHVYARLRRHAAEVQRVVLVGPAHRVPLHGCAVPVSTTWRTPLGDVAVEGGWLPPDDAGVRRVVADDAPHAPEHSLEVQLPFLQRALAGRTVPVLPVAVGFAETDDVAALIAAAMRPGTVLLCSTDLSHYLPEQEARGRDRRTVWAVLELAPRQLGTGDACGVYALRGTVAWARDAGLAPRLLRYATSAEASGDLSRVVGYPAIAFDPHP